MIANKYKVKISVSNMKRSLSSKYDLNKQPSIISDHKMAKDICGPYNNQDNHYIKVNLISPGDKIQNGSHNPCIKN